MLTLLAAALSPAWAADLDLNGCVDAWEGAGACVAPGALVDASATLGAGLDVGAGAVIAPRAAVGGSVGRAAWVDAGAAIGRRASLGADPRVGLDTAIARAVTAGARFTSGTLASVGYAAMLGDDVTLADGASVGNLAQVGSGSGLGLGASVGREARLVGAVQLGDGASVGPGATLTGPITAANDARVMRGASIGANVTLGAGAVVGRGATVQSGASIGAGAVIRADANIGQNATVAANDTIARGEIVPSAPSMGGGAEIGFEPDGSNIAPDPSRYRRPTATGGSFDEWNSGEEALVSDGYAATTTTAGARQSFEGFGFSIPGSNTVGGITVKVDAAAGTAAGTIEVALSSDGGATWSVGRSTPTLTVGDVVHVVGGQSDGWGRSWSPGHFSDASFRVRVTAQPAGNALRLDGIEVWVYHMATGGGAGGGAEI